jgi:hypothetical protein
LTVLLAAAVCATAGCPRNPSVDQPPQPTEARGVSGQIEASEILQRMIKSYQNAPSYSDRGVVSLRYRVGESRFQDDADLAVTLARPNKLSVRAYQVALACDGTQLRARVKDPSSRDLDGQFVVRAAPPVVSLPELYTDQVLHRLIASGLGRHPVQLELLLGEEPLKDFLRPNVRKRLLGDAEIAQRPCWRVEVGAAEGEFVFWVDREQLVLRRLEYPTGELAAQMARTANVSDVTVAAEFRDARFGPVTADNVFQLEAPEGAKQVRYFVLPPQPLPSNLFGQEISDFFFADLAGSRVSRDQLRGKIAIFVWIHDDANCQASLQELEKARQRFRGDEGLAFYVICTQPSTVSNDQLKELLRRWGVSTPAVRDLMSFGRDLFRIPGAPTLVVLDQRGRVQIVEAGFNPKLATELPRVLERLRAGEDLAPQIVAQFEREQAEYARNLADAGGR